MAGCCPPGSEPARPSDYKPRGQVIDVDGVPCYTKGDGVNAVIVVPDIFGYAGGRIRLITDQLADEGFTAICPKLLPNEGGTEGDGWLEDAALDGTLMPWIGTYPWDGNVGPKLMDKIIPYLEKQGKQNIGMLGFCWGAWAIFRTCSVTDRISCGVSCHPSLQVEGAHGGTPEELSKKVRSPQMLLPAGGDPSMVKPGGEVVKNLEDRFGDDIVSREFPEMNHGWVPRGDTSDEATKRDVKEAMTMAIQYLHKHLASPPRCCPPGSEPALAANYEPRGEVISIDETTAYTVGAGKNAIICIPDIFGFASGRMRLIADQLADAGYSVVLPKLLPFETGTEGDGWPESSNLEEKSQMEGLMAWIPKYPWEKVGPQVLDQVIPYLDKKGCEKIGMIGFCWGAWVNFRTCEATDRISCAVGCHPSVRLEDMFGRSPEDLAKTLKAPQMLMPAGNDPENVQAEGDVSKVLREKFGDDFVVREFPDMKHGWVPRGDVSDENTARDVKEAMSLAISYFGKHLA